MRKTNRKAFTILAKPREKADIFAAAAAAMAKRSASKELTSKELTAIDDEDSTVALNSNGFSNISGISQPSNPAGSSFSGPKIVHDGDDLSSILDDFRLSMQTEFKTSIASAESNIQTHVSTVVRQYDRNIQARFGGLDAQINHIHETQNSFSAEQSRMREQIEGLQKLAAMADMDTARIVGDMDYDRTPSPSLLRVNASEFVSKAKLSLIVNCKKLIFLPMALKCLVQMRVWPIASVCNSGALEALRNEDAGSSCKMREVHHQNIENTIFLFKKSGSQTKGTLIAMSFLHQKHVRMRKYGREKVNFHHTLASIIGDKCSCVPKTQREVRARNQWMSHIKFV